MAFNKNDNRDFSKFLQEERGYKKTDDPNRLVNTSSGQVATNHGGHWRTSNGGKDTHLSDAKKSKKW